MSDDDDYIKEVDNIEEITCENLTQASNTSNTNNNINITSIINNDNDIENSSKVIDKIEKQFKTQNANDNIQNKIFDNNDITSNNILIKPSLSSITNISKVSDYDLLKSISSKSSILNLDEDHFYHIKVLAYVWKSKILVAGHYEFRILISKKTRRSGKLISQRTIYRRYSDILLLYDGLIRYNPGCLIPSIPEKNFWANISLNSNTPMIEKRKEKIESYLNYIAKHKYLSHNPVFIIFISDDFERYKQKLSEGLSLYVLLKSNFSQNYSRYMTYLKGQTQQNSYQNVEISDFRLKQEKTRIEKIAQGTANLIASIEAEINVYKRKIDGFGRLFEVGRIVKDTNFRLEIDDLGEEFRNKKEIVRKDSENYGLILEVYKEYLKKIEDIEEKLITYKDLLFAMLEIFSRKETLEFNLKREQNSDFNFQGKSTEMEDLENEVKRMQMQFYDEMGNFQKNVENYYINYIESYTKAKKLETKKIVDILNKELILEEEGANKL